MMWYFRPSWWLPVKLVVLAWLVYALLFSLKNGGLRALASVVVVWAIPAHISWLLAVMVVPWATPMVFMLAFMPALLYVVQAMVLPVVWSTGEPRAKKTAISAAILLGGYVLALVFAWVSVTAVGWVADINPCVSSKVGVTGSRPPVGPC